MRTRTLLFAIAAAVALAIVTPAGCRHLRERVLLTLVHDSERPVEVLAADPPSFRFPPTPVRLIAFIDYDDARHADGHVSFMPPDGSDRYVWAATVCGSWAPACLEATPPAMLETVTYGSAPAGLRQIEPAVGAARDLRPNHLYGVALLGDKLFALKAFYRDDADVLHVMEGSRFAEAVVYGHREEIASFMPHDERGARVSHPARPSAPRLAAR